MSKLDVKLVEKMYSDYGQELTPERLDYITNQFSNNNDFSNSFLKKYDAEKAVSSTEVEKKNPVSTITSEETPSESQEPPKKKSTLSVGGNPVQTGASASSAGVDKRKKNGRSSEELLSEFGFKNKEEQKKAGAVASKVKVGAATPVAVKSTQPKEDVFKTEKQKAIEQEGSLITEKYKREEEKKFVEDFRNATAVPDDYEAQVRNEVQSELEGTGLWNTVTQGAANVWNKILPFIPGAPSSKEQIEQLKSEVTFLPKAMEEYKSMLLNDGVKEDEITTEDLTKGAINLEVQKRIDDKKLSLANDYLDNLPNNVKDRMKIGAFNQMSIKSPEVDNKFDLIKAIDEDIKADKEELVKLEALAKKNNGLSQEDADRYGLLTVSLEKKSAERKNQYDLYKKSLSELTTAEQEFDLFKRSYGFEDKAGKILNAVSDFGLGALQFVNMLTPGANQDNIALELAGIKNEKDKLVADKLQKQVDSAKNINDILDYGADVLISQSSNIALGYLTGGTGMMVGIGTSAAGNRYSGLIKSNLEGETDYSKLQMYISSGIYGASETIESNTMKMIGGAKNIIGKAIKNEPYRKLLSESLASKTYKTGSEFLKNYKGELGEELTTLGAQKISDIVVLDIDSKEVFKNAKEEIKSLVKDTGVMVVGLNLFPATFSKVTRAFAPKDYTYNLDKNNKLIDQLTGVLQNKDASDVTKLEAKNKIAQIVKSNEDSLIKVVKNTANIEDKLIDKIVEIENTNSNLRNKAEQINSDKTISRDQKAILLSGLKEEFKNNELLREDIILGRKTSFDILSDEDQAKVKQDAANLLKQEEINKGVLEEDINIPAETINKKAKELYNQKIKQENEKITGQTNAEEKPTGINAEQTTSATQQKDGVQLQSQEEVDKLRIEEIKELTDNVENPDSFITNGKVDAKKVVESDNAKAKEIYAKYDKLLKPLLNNIKTQEDAIQKQSTGEGLLQPEQSKMGLQEVEQGDKVNKVVAEQSEEKVNNYVSKLDEIKKSDPDTYWSVSSVTSEDASKSAIIDTKDGAAMVKSDGDIVGVFKKPESDAKGVAQDLLKKAIELGGIKLDNFDGYLTKQYEKAGFRVVSKTPFNEEYAPEGWNKDKHGTPDVVAMVYDPKGELNIEEKTFNDKDTGYDDMIAYRDKLISDQAPKFQKSKIEIDGSTVDLITEEMNSMPEEIAKFDIPSNLTTKEKTNIGSLTDRFNDKVKTIKDISELDGVPFIFTISDQLTSGQITNPFTGNTIDVKGGIGFNMTEGNEGNAWANTTEAEANNMLQRATEVYSKNKDLFDRLWSEGKVPNGHVPMAVVKMGQTSIKSNEALFRFASDTFKKKFSKAKRIAAKNGLLKDLKSAKDIDQDVIDFVAKQNTIDEVLDNIKELSISKRPDITGFVFTGGIKLGAKTRPGKPKSSSGRSLVGDNKNDYKYVHLQTINNLISEPATASIPDSHIVSVVGVDVLNPSVTKVDHQNYPFGVKGQLIGILENPVHAADVFPEMYSKSIYLQKENKAGVPTSPETAVRQSVAAGGAVANIKAFRGAKIATKMTDLQKLLGKLKLAFPSVTIVDTKEEFLKELENPNVKRFVKDGDVVYGFTKDGKVFLNPEKANSNTAIHEYSHIWTVFLKENNPSLLKKGYDLLEGTSILNDKISEFGDNELARDEAMAELIANKGETIIEASIKSKFKNWLNAVFNYVKANFKSFDKMSATELQNLNLNQFLDGALSSLLGGKEVTSKEVKGIGVKFSKETNKQELSDTKKEIQDVFSAAKEALKIEKDKNKVINDLKNKVNAFVKVAIQDLNAGDIGKRAITSIASKVQSVTDQNFDEKLLEVNAVLDNLYTNRDVNKAKADKKKALKNVMAGKVGRLDKRGDRAKVMASKIVNFALLDPAILKKVLDDANFGLYTSYISNLAERKDALSDTDLKSYDKLYDEIVVPYKEYTDKVNQIQGKIDTNVPLTAAEQAFVDKNKSDFYEKEDVEAEEEKDAEKKAKKEAEIAKKKDTIKALLPMMPQVFEDSDAEKGSFEWKILSALTTLDESDIDAMPESILSNVTNALNSMINDDVVPTYAEDLYRYAVKNKAKNLFLDTVAKAGKGGLYKTKAGRAALKVREVLGNPITTIRGIIKGDVDAELLDKRIKMFRFSAIDAALKIYGETPIFDGIASVLGKGMSNLANTEAKAEEALLNAKKLIDKKSKNAQESYMKITYHLIDAMAKNNQGTKSGDVSAMEYFESTISDPNSKIRENKAALKVVQDFVAKVKANGGSIELTPEEATAANAIRIVLDENQVTAYEANLFQNANAAPMIAEYFPVSNSVKSQTDNDLANMQSRFGIGGTVSTKSGNLEEKTGKAHPVDMNPFTAAFSSIKNTAVQFNLRSEYLSISQGLNESINEAVKNGDRDSELFLNGIKKALDSEFDLIINGSVFGSNDLMDNVFNAIDKTFYQVMLGSVISRSVDYTGNIIQLAALNPKLLVSGNKIIKDLKGELKSGESEVDLLRAFYKNAEASDINKMISSKSSTTERTEFLNKGVNKDVLSKGLPFSNIFTKIKAKFVTPVDEKLGGINESLISISDVKPYGISWNSIFRDTFLSETGNDVDVAKVARGDKKYLKDNADAIKRASNKANRESADLFGSTNPFEKQVGIMEVTAGKKNSRNPLSALINRAKYFLSGFNIGANTSMTTAINTFLETKDPREARKALGGAIRVGMYRTAVSAVSGMIWSLFKGDDDDEDKLVESFDKLAEDDKFIKEMNNLFLDFPIRKDRDGNPVNLSMNDFEQYNKLRDKLLSNKDFKNAYDIYYKFINRNLFDEAVRLRANQINGSKEKVFKENIVMFFDEIKAGFPKDDTQIIETLAVLHSNEGAKLFTSDEVDGYILDLENHMSKIGFLDNRALRGANSQIDRMIINETALLLSDHRNQSAGDIIVKEGAQLLMGLMFPRSNNLVKGSYNYAAESANKMMIQSRKGERGYDIYKDMVFQPIVKTGLSDKKGNQEVVKEVIGILNPALKDLLKKDNADAATVSMLRYIKTIGTIGLNDFNKINSKMKNDEIYQKTNGKFRKNIINEIAKDKVDIIRSVTDKEGIESDVKEKGAYKSRVLPGIDSTEVKSNLPSYMDKKDLKINGRSVE
jgi:hypothetical protein